MATANAVKALQEADETIEQDPVCATTHTGTYSFSINIPVSLPICHSPSSPSWQQEESSSPKLQRVDQTMRAEGREKVESECQDVFKKNKINKIVLHS